MKDIIAKIKAAITALTGVDETKKRELEAQLADLERQATQTPAKPVEEPAKPAKADDDPRIAAIEQGLADVKKMLEQQEQRFQDSAKAEKDRKDAEAKKRLEDYRKQVVETEKKVTPAEWDETYKPLLEANFEVTKKIIDARPVHPSAKKPDAKPTEDGKKPVGIMASAPAPILAKIREYTNVTEN